ncbi:MAG: hypothetical protein ACRECO_13935 [Xanthobacteraceae bacterium]
MKTTLLATAALAAAFSFATPALAWDEDVREPNAAAAVQERARLARELAQPATARASAPRSDFGEHVNEPSAVLRAQELARMARARAPSTGGASPPRSSFNEDPSN